MRRGYVASGLKDISSASAAPIGSLYHHFPGGKAELASEVLRVSGVAYQQLVESVWDAAPDVPSAVRDVFDGAAAVLRATDFADACPIATVALEVASTDDELRLVTAEVFEGWLVAATDRLAAAGLGSERARQLATTIVAGLEGGFLLSRAARDTAAIEAIGASMVRLVEAALETTG